MKKLITFGKLIDDQVGEKRPAMELAAYLRVADDGAAGTLSPAKNREAFMRRVSRKEVQ